ncbi:MAG TPA: L,D-transpeptidase/peptidoglycan binding protein [Candidatus Merdenecus merdavium]|nr:L,D-transpeptidase/peptidoglycan binding protein [Candidatus Merdenecus merdavium]
MSRKKKKSILTLAIISAIIVIGYIGGAVQYWRQFLPGTYINDIEVSNLTVIGAEREIGNDAGGYILTIFDEEGRKDEIKGSDFNLVYDMGNKIKELKKRQNPLLWFIHLFRNKDYTVEFDYTYNKDQLENRLNGLDIFTNHPDIAPVDARLSDENGSYEILPEENGQTIDREKVKSEVMDAINTQKTQVHLSDYMQVLEPKVKSDDLELVNEAERLNELMDIRITYEFGSQSRVLDGSTIKDWVTVDDSGNIEVDRSQVLTYVQGLASDFNTVGEERQFQTTDGRNITIEGGDYGWVINKEKETDALMDLIKNRQTVTREPIYEATAATHDGQDTGNPDTYVEIDFTNQRLYYYLNGRLELESPIVSGKMGVWPTRSGVFAMTFKANDYYMPEYNVDVDYFIGFYTDVGLHDASWRSLEEFGGTTYQYDGSHGCINMPKDKVEEIYKTISKEAIFFCYY